MGPHLTDYGWITWIDATIAVSTSPAALLLEAYGAEAALGEHTFREASELQLETFPDHLTFHLQLRQVGDFTVLLESNGWTGSIPEVARRCSVGGHFFSVYWNQNTDGQLTEAKDGRITARFNSVTAYYPYEVQFDTRPAWAIGPRPEPGTDVPLCLAHLEAQTGVAFQQTWLDEQMPTYRIKDPAVAYPSPWV
ncbi:DUF6461 domain-containing protein [Kribbella sp. NPDC048928]|uniref:DUF6461 domain-containing protein n=1 Tax=Kribbella sp. NPDC048928 TaxID=3364111 RepID=UPI00371F9731